MLQKLNERIQGLIAWIVIILIAITFTLFGVDYYLQKGQSKQAKAEVNGEFVDIQTFESTYRRARSQQDAGQMTSAQDKLLRENILDSLVANKLAVQGAEKLGFWVSANQADATILGIPQFQENGRFSSERYQQALSGAMFTPQTFQKEVRQGMILNQQRFAFIGTSFLLPEEMNRFVRLYMQSRDYDYSLLSIKDFSKTITVSDEKIKQYFNAHQDDFKTDEMLKLKYVALDMNHVRDGIQVSDADAKAYYDNNKNNFLVPAKWQVAHIFIAAPQQGTEKDWQAAKEKAEKIYNDLAVKPQSFDEMVKTKSDDKLSVAKNGLLPWINAGQTPFDKILLQLKNAGEISKPLKTSRGFEIFQLKEYVPARLKPYADVKNLIIQQIKAEKTQERYTVLMEQLTELSFQNADSLKTVSKTMNLPVQETVWFGRQGGKDKLTKNKKLINTAFSQDVLDAGNNSEPLSIDNDQVVVVRVAEHKPSRNMKFDEVKETIKAQLVRDEAINAVKAFGQKLIDSSAEQRQALMQQQGIKWVAVKDAKRDMMNSLPEVNQLAFTMNMKQALAGEMLTDGNYALVELKNIHPGKESDLDKEQQKSIRQQLEASYGLMAYDLYMKTLQQTAEIKKY